MITDPAKLAEFDQILQQWYQNFRDKSKDLHCPHAEEHDDWFELTELQFDGWSSFTYHVKGCCVAFETLILNAATEERMFNPPTFNTGIEVPKYATENDNRSGAVDSGPKHAKKSDAHAQEHVIHEGGHSLSEVTRSNVERWFEEVWNDHEMERIREWVAPDCKVHSLDGSFRKGPEAFEELFAVLHEAMPDIHVEVKYHVVEHDKAASLLLISGSPRTSKGRCEFTAMTFSRWSDGKIIEAWSLADLDSSLMKAKEAIQSK